jgi:chromosome segregation ATPase
MGHRLLLVDSDRSFLKEHQASLEAAFDLEVRASPEGVLPQLESGAFAAVLICVEVADNKGYALCSGIRKHANLDGLKIVLISAKATAEEYRRHQSLKGKADLYLHKPITSSALVTALTPLVPGRVLDPDKPFGDLVDADLGDDWLDNLKSSLDEPVSSATSGPIFGVRSPSSAKHSTPDVRPEVNSEAGPDHRQVRLLEEQLAALQEELRVRDQRLAEAGQRLLAAEAEAQQLQRQMNSVTLNLDELERRNRESETLKTRLTEAESALRSLEATRGREGEALETLKNQFKETLIERTDLLQQVETLNQQVGDKTQRFIELLKERDRLLGEALDLEPFRAKAQDLEAALAAQAEASAARQQELESMLAQRKEELHSKRQELDSSLRAQSQLNATLEALVEQHTNLEAALGASQAELLERDQLLRARQESIQCHEEEKLHLEAELAGVRQELDEARILHEGQQLELMNGLDHKEAEISRLRQTLADQQEAHAVLDREKQALHGQLSEHRDRLQNLDGLLREIQEKLRRGSDLARG